MGRVAWLILLVVVSVCGVFCVLCCLQNNLVFLSVTILSHISKNETYELCIFAGFFVDQITTGKNYDRKKRYSRLAVSWNKSQITVCRVKIQTPTITGKITAGKKVTVVWPSVGIRVKIRTPNSTTGKNYDRKKKKVRVKNTASTTSTGRGLCMASGSGGAMIWWCHCSTHGERGGKAAGG